MRNYELMWNFPNVCGAMDGKHVNIRCPPHTDSQFFNYMKSYSPVLFAVVDAEYNFLYIDIDTNGRVNDATVFSKSSFSRALATNSLNIPERGIFLGDDAFPLKTNILKPFARYAPLTQSQLIFNYRLSRARRVVENTFGILVSKFRIFGKLIPLSVNTTKQVVKTICVLHNWLQKTASREAPYVQRDLVSVESWNDGRIIPGRVADYAHEGLLDLPPAGHRNHGRASGEVRRAYAGRFITTDSVPWQWNMI